MKHAFTIVELLIVMVVIGIVATVTLISFAGISSKAVVATLQSDLTNARRSILNFQAQSTTSSFPTSITACPTPGATELCLTPTAGNTFSYTVNNTLNPAVFTLTATNGTTKYWVNDSTSPITTPNIVTDGLVLNLDAANPASYPGTGTTWYDLSGNVINGTFVSGTGYSSVCGGIFTITGGNYINVLSSSLVNFDSDFTVSIWIKSPVYIQSQGIFQKTDSGGYSTVKGFSITNISNPQTVYIWISNGVSTKIYNTGLNSYDWTEITVIRSGSTVTTYINAVQKNTLDLTSFGSINGSQNLQIGRGNNLTWSGYLSKVSMYGRALTQSEITQNFNALRGRYGI